MKIKTIIFAVFTCFFVSACQSPVERVDFKNESKIWYPYRLSVAEVKIAASGETEDTGEFKQGEMWGKIRYADFDPEELRLEIAKQIEKSELFPISEENPELILRIKLERPIFRFDGFENWGASFALWVLAWVPSWYYADEVFAVDFSGMLEIESAYNGKLLYQGHIHGTYTQRLNDFERGWMLYGLFRVPDAYGEENWKLASEAVAPFAVNRLSVYVASFLASKSRFYRVAADKDFEEVLKSKK